MKYTVGTTIQGKRRTKSYKIHKVEAVPKEEWIKVENTHEPIIDKEIFEKAQELNSKDTKVSQRTKELSIWAGFLKCADCKRAMNKKSSTNKSGKKYEYYICSTYRKKSNNLCSKHSIKAEVLEKAVLQAINLHIKTLIDTKKMVKQLKNNKIQNDRNETIENMINIRKNEILKISNFKRTLYEDWKNEFINEKDYLEYKQKYENDIKELEQNIITLRNEIQKNKIQNKSNSKWIEIFERDKMLPILSRDIIIELIDCIFVKENGDIIIKFKFKDELKSN